MRREGGPEPMDEIPSSKRYEPPSINLQNRNDSHTLIVELAGAGGGAGNLILEVGTSTGYLTRILRDLGNRVIGIEVDVEAAKIAEKYCDLMITGDVEEIDLDDYLAPGSIDVAVFGDVLEHLRYPASVLKKVRRFLKPQGSVVISIPNVCHGDVLINLLNGDFRYTSMGLLDETHLRFFGLKNVLDLLDGSGYSITEIRTTRLPVGGTELRRDPEEVPREIRRFIEGLPNADVYQFVLLAKPGDDPKRPQAQAADLKAIFDRSVEDLLKEHEEPLRREVAEVLAKSQEASERLEALKEELERARERGQSLELAVSERDGRIAELSCELAEARERAKSLDQAVSERDGRIAELSCELEEAGERARSLDQAVSEREGRIAELKDEIQKAVELLASLDRTLSERDVSIANLKDKLSKSECHAIYMEKEVIEMRRSIVWQLLMKYHNGFVERALPHDTGRRNKYDLALKGGRILVNEGWESFWWKFNDYRRQTKVDIRSQHINVPEIVLIDGEEEIGKLMDFTISVIIPTKNAGDEFEYLLNMLKNQRGVREVEIVIVDSGSTDKTLDLANTYGAKIINIPPEKFSHSYARNLGADNAKGKYILFTVQDSLPPSQTWLYELLTTIERNDVVAVSCAEFPREDADLFYRAVSWNHYRFLEVDESDRLFSMPERETYINMRKNGQLSDIACLIPRDIFMKYRYRLDYAEDLDLGMRLIKDGHKIAFLSSIRIIHSHNRPAYYFLKRGYVDNLFLSNMFKDFLIPSIKIDYIARDIIITYNCLNQFIKNLNYNLQIPSDLNEFISTVKTTLKSASNFERNSFLDIKNNPYIDENFELFLKRITNHFIEECDISYDSSILLDAMLNYMEIIFDYMRKSYELVDIRLLEDFKLCIFKIYAILCGSHIAYCYLQSTGDELKKLKEIDYELTQGV